MMMAEEKLTITFVTKAFAEPRRVTRPDFARLFPLTDECDEQCGECDNCEDAYAHALFSPRAAALMYQATEFLYDDLHDDDNDYTQLKELLPRTGGWESPRFYDRFVNIFERFQNALSVGEFPSPQSIAEELALNITLGSMREHLGMVADGESSLFDYPELIDLLPTSPEDFNLDSLSENLFEDTDFLTLYNASFTHADHNLDRVQFNFPDMRVHIWFNPFRPDAK